MENAGLVTGGKQGLGLGGGGMWDENWRWGLWGQLSGGSG